MKIVLAVSGGVDSVAMLHSLLQNDGFAESYENAELIVAHFDHGIREDSAADERFVEELAKKYSLKFASKSVTLSPHASESEARKLRWQFLLEVRKINEADFVATAHHSDDVFETQIINLIRGTGRRGINVLNNTKTILRPLIGRTKSEIYSYVLKNNLEFVEDSTNQDTRYLRNKLRLKVLPSISKNDTEKLKTLFKKINGLNNEIDNLLVEVSDKLLQIQQTQVLINRAKLLSLSENIQLEVLRKGLDNFEHKKQKVSKDMLIRLQKFANRKDSNKDLHLSKLLTAHITKHDLQIKVDYKS